MATAEETLRDKARQWIENNVNVVLPSADLDALVRAIETELGVTVTATQKERLGTWIADNVIVTLTQGQIDDLLAKAAGLIDALQEADNPVRRVRKATRVSDGKAGIITGSSYNHIVGWRYHCRWDDGEVGFEPAENVVEG